VSRYFRETTARSTGTAVQTGHADDMGLDRGRSDYDGIEYTLWYNVCEHGSCCGHLTLALAKRFASAPEEWCEECREIFEPSDAPEWTI